MLSTSPPAESAPARQAHPVGMGDPQKEERCIRSRHAALFAAIISLFSTASAGARKGCQTHRCAERVAMKKCSQRNPRWCVERAILEYRLASWQAAWMRRIPGCESHWNPLAYFPSQVAETRAEQEFAIRNGRSAGLFEFKPSTWRGTRYGDRSIWLAKWNSLAAAWMVRAGRTGEWACT